MNLIALVVRQSRAVVTITALVAAAGLLTGFSLPSDIYPPLQFPRIVVIAHAGMTPADSMVLTVTRPIEQAIMEVPGIRRVRSRSIRGAAEISAQFAAATDMVVALQQVQNRISEIRGELPEDAEVTVERLTPAVFPVLILSVTGSLSTPELTDYALDWLKTVPKDRPFFLYLSHTVVFSRSSCLLQDLRRYTHTHHSHSQTRS